MTDQTVTSARRSSAGTMGWYSFSGRELGVGVARQDLAGFSGSGGFHRGDLGI